MSLCSCEVGVHGHAGTHVPSVTPSLIKSHCSHGLKGFIGSHPHPHIPGLVRRPRMMRESRKEWFLKIQKKLNVNLKEE